MLLLTGHSKRFKKTFQTCGTFWRHRVLYTFVRDVGQLTLEPGAPAPGMRMHPVDILRPYQKSAVETLQRLAREKQFLLLQAATGAGKTVMAASLMQHYADNWRFRCLFLAHKAILVRQALSRMQATFEDADFDVNVLCASVERPGTASGHIIVASPQTLARRLDDLPKVDVVIIDECHRVPPKGQSSLYAEVIRAVTAKRPGARVFGITATPWRLGQGPIYGPSIKPGLESWWDTLDVRLSIAELQEEGWLSPLTALCCAPDEVLLAVPVGSSGDFSEDALEATLLKPLHLGSAVKAVETHCAGRSRIAVFCVTIAHARALAARFREEGFLAAAIDSKMGQQSNLDTLHAFERGEIRVLCSVGMLTEGWDCPATDCLVLCRPTLSPALYVQMVGRGLRVAEGKTDCLLVDLSGNVYRHGSPNAPRIRQGRHEFEEIGGFSSSRDEEEQVRRCPFCDAVLPEEVGLKCPECLSPFYDFEESRKNFREIDLSLLESRMRHGEEVRKVREEKFARETELEKERERAKAEARARWKASLLNGGKPVVARVVGCTSPENYRIRNGAAAGALALKVDLVVEVEGVGRRGVQLVLDPEGAMGRKARSAFWALRESRDFWKVCGKGTFPASRAGIVARWPDVRLPDKVVVKQTMGGWVKILWNEDVKTVEAGESDTAENEGRKAASGKSGESA